MTTPDNLVLIYKELADAHERQGQPQMRDRYLVLAADAAQGAGRAAEADLLLARLLRSNPHHMLRPFASFAEAMASPDIRNYVGELRRTHPPEQAAAEFDALRAGRNAPPPPRQTRALPPTAPVVNLDDEMPSAEIEREPLKVYRVQDDAETVATPVPPRAARPAATRPPTAPPMPPPRPPRPVPRAPEIVETHLPPPPLPADAEDVARGAWLSLGLFLLVLVAGAALAGWVLLRPFVPHG